MVDARPGRDLLPADLAGLLSRLAEELAALYGERYRGLILYGSYARGEADPMGSDVDLLLLLDGEEEIDTAREIRRSGDVKWPMILESGYLLSVLPVSAEDYETSDRPFLWNAREEGVRIR